MSKYEIEVEGLPEGWETVAYKYPKIDDHVFLEGKIRKASEVNRNYEQLIVKKKQPRRITFEETDHTNICELEEGIKWTFFDDKYWREVKETEEPKLFL